MVHHCVEGEGKGHTGGHGRLLPLVVDAAVLVVVAAMCLAPVGEGKIYIGGHARLLPFVVDVSVLLAVGVIFLAQDLSGHTD